MRLLKYPVLYAIYADLTNASALDTQRHMSTFKTAMLEMLRVGGDLVHELTGMVKAL
ncbi:MAG: hypothetical protein OXG35_05470 [Acidobacteria bacterium]|nr:hypothetical protein [Acidobacteriota bacterium]